MESQILAILQLIEEQLIALIDIATKPDGRVQQAQNDTLRIYGDTAQLRETFGIIRNQISALSDVMTIYLSKIIEHDRRMIAQHDGVLLLLQSIASGVGMAEVVLAATEARAVLDAEAMEQHAAVELSATQARRLLKLAQMDALSLVKQAVDEGQAAIAHDAETARDVIAEAADEARDQIEHEKDES